MECLYQIFSFIPVLFFEVHAIIVGLFYISYSRLGLTLTPCMSCMVCPMPYMFKSVWSAACWCFLYSFCFGLGRQAQYIFGVVRGGSCSGFGVFPVRLSEQVDTGTVLPLQALHTDLMFRQPRPLDALVCGPHQSDGNPTLGLSARPRLGLLPLCCKAAGYPFQLV